jgi:hypothetical protein
MGQSIQNEKKKKRFIERQIHCYRSNLKIGKKKISHVKYRSKEETEKGK